MKFKTWYREKVFPTIMALEMENDTIQQMRKRHIEKAEGVCLEIGIGQGKSLKYYKDDVKVLYAIEPNKGMHQACKKEAVDQRIQLILSEGKDKELEYRDEMFDTVILQFVMCSISELPHMLEEIRRVLKVGGKLIFIEHGRSGNTKEAIAQDLINPLFKMVGEGCHVNRNYMNNLKQANFSHISLKRYKTKGLLPLANTIYEGYAVK